ncbi:protein kinase [Moniliophthora roreri]|nr:protein kinase [Moniliophthora roreri]
MLECLLEHDYVVPLAMVLVGVRWAPFVMEMIQLDQDIWKGRLNKEQDQRGSCLTSTLAPTYSRVPWDHGRAINYCPPVIHADIKGVNILVSENGTCYPGDFGLSIFEDRTENKIYGGTRQVIVMGSVPWLAPELINPDNFGAPSRTTRDIYAFGCTIFKCEKKLEMPIMIDVLHGADTSAYSVVGACGGVLGGRSASTTNRLSRDESRERSEPIWVSKDSREKVATKRCCLTGRRLGSQWNHYLSPDYEDADRHTAGVQPVQRTEIIPRGFYTSIAVQGTLQDSSSALFMLFSSKATTSFQHQEFHGTVSAPSQVWRRCSLPSEQWIRSVVEY